MKSAETITLVLRKLDPTVKIIAASGLLDHEKVRDATGMDNIAFLLKPYTAEKLLLTLRKVIGSDNAQLATVETLPSAVDKAA